MRNPDVMNPAFVLPDRMTASDARALGIRVDVDLDGALCRDVVEYDAAHGWVRRLARDDRGFYMQDNLGLLVERVTGKVQARIAGYL